MSLHTLFSELMRQNSSLCLTLLLQREPFEGRLLRASRTTVGYSVLRTVDHCVGPHNGRVTCASEFWCAAAMRARVEPVDRGFYGR